MTGGKPGVSEASDPEVRDPLRAALDAAGLGTFDLDLSTRRVRVDRRTREAFGLAPDRAEFEVEDLFAVIHPDDRPKVEQSVEAAERTVGTYSVEHRVCLPDDERWLDVHGQAVHDPSGASHIIGTVRDSTELRSARDDVARVLEHVGEAFLSLDHNGNVTYVNAQAEQLLGRGRDHLVGRVFTEEVPPLLGAGFHRLAASGLGTAPHVLEEWSTKQGVWLELRIHPHPGGTSIYFSDVTMRRAAQDRNRRLQRVAAALARAVTTSDVAKAALDHATRGVEADSAGVLLVDEERRELRLVAGFQELDEPVRQRWSRVPLSATTPLHDAITRSEPQLLTAREATQRFPHLARDLLDLGAGFYALLPLVTAGTPLGLLCLGWRDRDGLDDDELAFLVAIAAQCAQALERAQLYEQQRRIAESLQRSLLPQGLPEVPHVDFGARYLAGSAGLQVGGDWYDVLPLPDGRVAFALGDVVGKGLPAAAAMGQVRYALQAYAALDPSPASVLTNLDDFFAARDDEEIVTLIYGLLDPQDGVLVWSNAGHPPPVLLGAEEPRTVTARSDGTPLGVRTRRQESTMQLSAGESLFLYSDGLVESRERPVGEGVEALLSLVGSEQITTSTADEIAGAVLAAMLDVHEAEDDATVLAVRWTGSDELAPGESPESEEEPPHVASTKLRPEALASSSARRFVRNLLDRWQLLELSDVAELCVSELVTNAVLHARTPIQLEVRAGAGVLHVDVCDSGGARIDLPPRQEPGDGLESGRGLYIVQALSTRTGVRAVRGGTCVWFELELPSGEDGPEEHAELTGLS